MAQLSDDCFAFGGDLMLAAEAHNRLLSLSHVVVGSETCGLAEACGRVLSEDIIAGCDVPPHNNSAVDGWAVYFEDLSQTGETKLKWRERIPAGRPLVNEALRGYAVRIFTGAPMPLGKDGSPGPNTVLMQEDCREENGIVSIPLGIKRGANCRKAGEDIQSGKTILSVGHFLRPQDIGMVASVGITKLSIYKQLRVAIFSSGDEVFEPGIKLPLGGIYDSNRLMIIAFLKSLGCKVSDFGILPDQLSQTTKALEIATAEHDLVITSGGVSTGEEDHIKTAIEYLGHLNFWRLAIRPGRPIAFGQIGRIPFIGLPGNPVAAVVTFLRFARPLILRLSGGIDVEPKCYQVQANFTYKKKKGRREWLRVRTQRQTDGSIIAEKYYRDGAGILSSIAFADGLIELEENIEEVVGGMIVDFFPFNEMTR